MIRHGMVVVVVVLLLLLETRNLKLVFCLCVWRRLARAHGIILVRMNAELSAARAGGTSECTAHGTLTYMATWFVYVFFNSRSSARG